MLRPPTRPCKPILRAVAAKLQVWAQPVNAPGLDRLSPGRSTGKKLPQVLEDRAELALWAAPRQEATPHPAAHRPGGPYILDRNGRRRAGGVESEENLRALPLAALRPAERPRPVEVHDLELRESRPETRPESSALPQRAVALDGAASWEPLGNAVRVGEHVEHPVGGRTDVFDESVPDGTHGVSSACVPTPGVPRRGRNER